ncbi:N-acetyl-beta-glucosaminyl-glycoprotein 4-beta-N-acetylgalactosaminyltransferase 1 [Clarias gariepinus]|uniref:N-acetyl-beta-glucosaminyl-glycoprotein 4-beta-N-acetylgalactosaminyltransferase 1 n=1 Tax=Clarias gariepinus TaxID=13013 RepID=UPI00234D38DD|nr:N-acetyl-beta-glucosaminyl-glycoprotein 4-beta-N-acetylgalactosaminyltransferase 1 [Clarias gariepinus]
MVPFIPSRKIRRNGKYLLLGALLAVVGVAVYLEYVARRRWSDADAGQQTGERIYANSENKKKDIGWSIKYVPQPWRPEYKGRVNLHVFEDWCGTSIASLRKNPHYPLYSHSRSTVKKLAVAPSWRNYGLRIFGYIHPSTSGEFLFAVGSIDNCEFWLSQDENPENLRLRAYVGKTGEEWTAPGEYNKYSSQVSKPVLLQTGKRFYFELIHKHNNRGTDHVEVAWRLNKAGTYFQVIDSKSLSLYTDESSLKMSDVSHIPQTAASHVAPPLEEAQAPRHWAEMLREDPRDTIFKMPLLDKSRVQSVLPECLSKPTFIYRIRAIGRYQGLHFVHLSYVYPNDFTRLTHMENINTCFYKMKPIYFEAYGFSRYMSLDKPDGKDLRFRDNGDYRGVGQAIQSEELDYHDDYKQHQQRKLFSNSLNERNLSRSRPEEDMNREESLQEEAQARDQENRTKSKNKALIQKPSLGEKLDPNNNLKNDPGNISLSKSNHKNFQPQKDDVINKKYLRDAVNDSIKDPPKRKGREYVKVLGAKAHKQPSNSSSDLWMVYEDSEMESMIRDMAAYDPEVRWNQTFQDSQMDFQAMRSDWIDLNCNVSGNLLISQSEASAVVQAFMEKLELKYPGQYSLQRVVDVVKRSEMGRWSRYLLELELMEASGARVRLVQYVHAYLQSALGQSWSTPPQLCYSKNFMWNPDATIHIIVPVKNQARWVKKLIVDMEELYHVTGDNNYNLIITDYSSTDMDVEQALKESRLPKYQYLRLNGNFERSAGLQAGINLITDNHSIVFLCDLHLHFPMNFFDLVRKHCVEGQTAFAPIVMRLNCGATPEEPNGYWEVNGFGLLGIYKSDLNTVGGMNTKEFKNRWGGEDWELLDRIVEAGLDVTRLYLRNFFHFHHSRRGMWNRKILRGT